LKVTLTRTSPLGAAEKARLLEVIGALEPAAKESLQRLAWTAQFVNFALINPMAPNSEWAGGPASVLSLKDRGIIGTSGDATSGASWLKNRDVGEAVGELFYGAMTNPFLDTHILLPAGFNEDDDDPPPISAAASAPTKP
jgi:hypothetical protein